LDEIHHKYNHQKELDLKRDKCFYNSGYYVFRIKENDWLSNKQEEIEKFQLLISFLDQLESLKNV